MNRIAHLPVFGEALPRAFVVALIACDSVVSLDPVIGDSAAVPAPEIVGEWTSDDTVVYRVTADPSNATAYVVRVSAPTTDEPDLGNVAIALRATRIQDRLLIEVTPSEADSLLGRVMRGYGHLLHSGYLHAVVVPSNDTLRAFPLAVETVRDALASGACPAVRGRAVVRSNSVGSRSVVLGGTASQLRSVVSCLLDRPGALAQVVMLHRPATGAAAPRAARAGT